MKNLLIPAAAFAAAALSTGLAVSPGYAAPTEIAVSYSDLDLSQAGDRRTLQERVERAARQVCQAETGASPLLRAAERDCRDEAVSDAATQFPTPESAID